MIRQTLYSLRILFKHRLYTGISLIGLAIAISSFWFIANYVMHAHQYDAFHSNHNRTYRLTMEISAGENIDHYAATGKPLGSVLRDNYSGIEAYAKMIFHGPVVLVNNKVFKETDFFSVNPETLDIFSFDFIRGSKKTCFSSPNSILLSKFLAEKYFNSVDVIGKQITVDESRFTIKGVFDDWPENSHLKINALFYSESAKKEYEAQDWFDLEQYNYVLLDAANNQKDLDSKLIQLAAEHVGPILEGSGVNVEFHSQLLSDLYFAPSLIGDVPKGNKKYINALAISGLLVLLIAGLNYINLSLSLSTQRAKEILLKKILGISQKQLLVQSSLESLIMTLLTLMFSTILVFTFDKFYFDYTGFHAIHIRGNGLLLLSAFLITFFFGLLGTSYSGAYLSFSSKIIDKGVSAHIFKRLLLGFQFAIASVMLIVTLTMGKQIDFMKNKDLGFSKEQTLIVDLPDNEELKSRRIQFREQIKVNTTIKNASLIGGGALPGEENGKEVFEVAIDGSKTERIYNFYRIDENYCGLLDIKFVSGRNFQASRLSDQNDAIIINESLAKSLNWRNPLGKIIWCYDKPREVIGVVKNFHNKSLHNFIEPVIFMFDTNYSTNLLVKASLSDVDIIKSTWTEFFPNIPFSLTHFDQFIDDMYANERQLMQLLTFFTIISLLLCCMGLFAIFSLYVLQRTKEMSIRRVLGANAINLMKSITSNYIIVAIVAMGMAIPVAWFILTNWLDGFSYHIQMNPLVFILSACLVLLVSFAAMAYHIIKVLNVNPVDSLSHE